MPGSGVTRAGREEETRMSSAIEEAATPSVEETTGALIGRIFEAGLAFMELLTIYTGDRLGLYAELADRGPATPSQLAGRADINERYAREWLEQQAATGFLEVDDPAKPAADRTYSISAAHAAVLADRESPAYLAYFGGFVPSMGAQAPAVVEAFRTGGGVPWSAFGAGIVEGQGFFNRSWLLGALGSKYLPSIADVHARLQADPAARVLDAACGVGWAGIAIAKAYPKVTVLGVDPDEASIERARTNAEEHGVADRVRFEVKDAAGIEASGPFDFAIVVEAIHDISRPVEVLGAIRRSLAPHDRKRERHKATAAAGIGGRNGAHRGPGRGVATGGGGHRLCHRSDHPNRRGGHAGELRRRDPRGSKPG